MRFLLIATTALVAFPASPRAQGAVVEGYTAYRAGEYEEAVAILSDELRARPEADAAVLLARVLREVGRYDEAEELLRKSLVRSPDRGDLHVELGEVLLDTGRADEAVETFDRAATSEEDGSLRARLRIAEIERYRGRDATRSFESIAAEYDAGSVRSSEGLATVAAALDYLGRTEYPRLRQALQLYDQAIAADSTNLDAQVALGNLFLSKFNGTDAQEMFELVLGRNPNHPDALLGMARISRFGGGGDAFELTEQSLAVNSNLVPARVMQARQYLDVENFSEADAASRRALGVNDRDAQALTMLAVSALLGGDHEEFRTRLTTVRVISPHDPDVFVTLAELAARNRLYSEAVAFADSAIAIDSLSWRGYALRGINRLRVGDMVQGRVDLEMAFAGDPFDVWTMNTLNLLDDLADYTVLESDRFQIVIPNREAGLLELYLTPLADAAWDSLTAHYGTSPAPPIRIEVFREHKDFSVRTIGLVGMGALGVSFGPVIAMDAPSARPAGSFHWGTTLWHELAHSFHMEVSRSRVPRWFTEGLAVFEERRARAGWGDRIDWEYLLAYLDDRLAPVENLNQGFMRPAYPQQIGFSYYQASLVFDFIDQRWGFPTIVDMLEGYGEGQNTDEIFATVLDLSLVGFAEAYDAYFQNRFAGPLVALEHWQGETRPTKEEIRERATTDSTDFLAQLSMGMSLLEAHPDSALPFLERAKVLFPEYAGADSPYWLLAVAHHRSGRLGKVAVELDTLTALNRAHYPGLRMLVEVGMTLTDTATAAGALADIQFVYPYEEADHLQLAAWYGAMGSPGLAIRERQAVLAMDPFNRAEALYRLAKAQWLAGERRGARSTVLQALERAPNYEEALELLLEIRGEER